MNELVLAPDADEERSENPAPPERTGERGGVERLRLTVGEDDDEPPFDPRREVAPGDDVTQRVQRRRARRPLLGRGRVDRE